jgi:hypothetical protein
VWLPAYPGFGLEQAINETPAPKRAAQGVPGGEKSHTAWPSGSPHGQGVSWSPQVAFGGVRWGATGTQRVNSAKGLQAATMRGSLGTVEDGTATKPT